MVDREDIRFATCYQLAALISSDWEEPSEEVKLALRTLHSWDEPGEPLVGAQLQSSMPLKLTASETAPQSLKDALLLVELTVVERLFRIILKNSDGWETGDSDTIKKEIKARISNYEHDKNELTKQDTFTCNIVI